MGNDAILQYWCDYMRAEHCTNRTINERMILIRSMLRHAGVKSVLKVTKPQLVAFLSRDKADGRPLAPRSKQHYRSQLHTFFSWLQDEGLRADNPAHRLPRAHVIQEEANPASTEDIEKVLHSGIYGQTVMKVLLYAYQGLRACEIAAVAGENIDWAEQTITIQEAKGGKVVTRPLHSVVYQHALTARYPEEGFWFPSPKSGHIRANTVSRVLSDAFRRAGIDHTAHDMRKWHGTTLLEAGADSIDVQHSLRHTNDSSLRFYLRPSQRRIRAAMESLPVVTLPNVRPRTLRVA